MGSRYSDIRRGAQLQQDLTNYITYLSTPRTPNVGGGDARGAQRQLYVTPFGQDIETDETVRVQAKTTSYTALTPYIVTGNGASVETTPGAKTVIGVNGYKPARVVWFRNTTRQVRVERSNVTNRQYLHYEGNRDSCPFGRAAATDDQIDVFNAIKADILTATSTNAVNRVSLTREKISL